ncbi:hypothetical protein A6R70_21975 [Agrobacterium rubi]|uniref:hypothetical protein n=1 Tax=Agrobacterium rubi TaxID=28099 RepID=UPI00201B6FB9|nr:hypothetical protein [Agrobacterium rubi]MCL6654948.1 hypothetical protein [Agrobacterium rubi]
MLPPVSAVSSVDLSSSTAAPRQETPQPAKTTAVEPAEPADVPPITSDANIRAVSGELRLSQNVSVLAETLGKLMNIARMDGESAETYVNRLVAGLQTIPADQKAMLEKALGTILRGISVDMLANILKSSSGPEAARLAVMFELSRSSPAAANTPKPTITPYLQDLVPENRVLIPQIRNANLPSPVVATTLAPAGELDLLLSTNVKITPSSVKQTVAPATVPSDSSAPLLPNTPNSSAKVLPPLPEPGSAPSKPPQQLAGLLAATVPSAAAMVQENALIETARPLLAPNQTSPNLVPQIGVEPDESMNSARMQQPLTPQIVNREILSSITNAFTGAIAKEMETLLLTVVTAKLPAQADVLLPSTPLLTAATIDGDHDAMRLPPPHAVVPPGNSDTAEADSTLTSSLRPEMVAAHRAAAALDINAAVLNQPALHGVMAAMVAKEGIPLPFVNYPAAGDEPESDAPPRGRWPSSEGESSENDGDQEPSDQSSGQEEHIPDNNEVIDHSLSQGANDDGSTGGAESYYLRMSSLS